MSFTRKQKSDSENYQGVYVIPVIGPKGSGKSFFINQLLEEDVMEVGDRLGFASNVELIEVRAELVERKIPLWDPKLTKLVIVDTPGYDDVDTLANGPTTKQKLKETPELLKKEYGTNWKLAGVIYLHNIFLARGGIAEARSFFRDFDELWGNSARRFVVLGTTQWTKIRAVEGARVKCREQDLQKFWEDVGGKGWVMQRVDDKNTSPWLLVETVLLKNMSPAFQDRSKKSRFEKYQGCCIIPIMGPTGVGKSSFINELLGRQAVEVGIGLNSCTTRLQPVEVSADIVNDRLPQGPSSGKKLIIVDTPGFNDTSADDSEILKRISDWLAGSYGADAKLAGIIYLQEITQDRVTGSTRRNFEVFDKLCGRDACKSVVLGTTKWGDVPSKKREMTEAKEQGLRNQFWRDMIEKGSTMQRVDDKQTNASPWDLVRTILLKSEYPTLLIQKELIEMDKSLPQTEAAQVLRERIKELIKCLKSQGASEEEIRALKQEVAVLKQKSIFARLFGHMFR